MVGELRSLGVGCDDDLDEESFEAQQSLSDLICLPKNDARQMEGTKHFACSTRAKHEGSAVVVFVEIVSVSWISLTDNAGGLYDFLSNSNLCEQRAISITEYVGGL